MAGRCAAGARSPERAAAAASPRARRRLRNRVRLDRQRARELAGFARCATTKEAPRMARCSNGIIPMESGARGGATAMRLAARVRVRSRARARGVAPVVGGQPRATFGSNVHFRRAGRFAQEKKAPRRPRDTPRAQLFFGPENATPRTFLGSENETNVAFLVRKCDAQEKSATSLAETLTPKRQSSFSSAGTLSRKTQK